MWNGFGFKEKRMHLQESKRVLRNANLFYDLNDIHLDLVLMVCEEANYLGGEYIFHQGDLGDALYIIAHGEVEIILEPNAQNSEPRVVTVLRETEGFGEVILLEEGRRTAGVRCLVDTQLLRIPRKRLLKLCYDYPEIGFRIMYRMAAELAVKLRDSNLNICEQLFEPGMQKSPEAQA
jgi:CRP-like cAMP-binding protein